MLGIRICFKMNYCLTTARNRFFKYFFSKNMNNSSGNNLFVRNCNVLCDLVLFLQFKKREKYPGRSVTSAALVKVTLLHGCFSHSLNSTNSAKSRNAPCLLKNLQREILLFSRNGNSVGRCYSNKFPTTFGTIIALHVKKTYSNSLETNRVYSTLKRHENSRFHVVLRWNTRGVFVRRLANSGRSIFRNKC